MAQSLKTLAQLTLSTAGTSQAVSATSELAQSIKFTVPSGSPGTVYIGDSNVSSTRYVLAIAPGSSDSLNGDAVTNGTADIDLADVYFDASANSSLLNVGYLQRSNN